MGFKSLICQRHCYVDLSPEPPASLNPENSSSVQVRRDFRNHLIQRFLDSFSKVVELLKGKMASQHQPDYFVIASSLKIFIQLPKKILLGKKNKKVPIFQKLKVTNVIQVSYFIIIETNA